MFQGKHIDRQAEKLADVQDETHVNRLKDLEAETLVPILFNTLAEVQENHLATLLTKWRSKARVKTLAYTRAEVDAKQIWEHTSQLQGRSTD